MTKATSKKKRTKQNETLKTYMALFLVTGKDKEEALKRIVLGVMGFGSILGDKIQVVEYDGSDEWQPELMFPSEEILKGWLAVDIYNRKTTNYEMIEELINKVVADVKNEIRAEEPTIN